MTVLELIAHMIFSPRNGYGGECKPVHICRDCGVCVHCGFDPERD